jgi:cbb3-type cytochrome oxidase maturation protein
VRADIDGTEARLGSAGFCGIADAAHAPHGSDASFITFTHDGAAVTIPIRQTLRPDAVAVIDALRKRGLDLIMLSGDRPNAVAPIAKGLGIAKWQAGLKPAEKIAKIEELKAQGHRVLMVGDGLNDGPSAGGCACLDLADHGCAPDPGACGRGVSWRSIEAGPAGGCHLAARSPPDEGKFDAGGDLQFVRGAAGDCRTGDAADRRGCHVGIVAAGHLERAARAAPPGSSLMNVLIYLVPLALMLGLTGLVAFLWSLKSGQYDDLDGAAVRILPDDDIASHHIAPRDITSR